MALLDFLNASDIKKENVELKELLQKIGATDIIEVQRRINSLKSEEAQLIEQKNRILSEIKTQEIELSNKKNQIIAIDEEIMLESFALYKPQFSFQTSDEYKTKLDAIRESQKSLIKSGQATDANMNWTVNGSKTEGKKMVNDMIKLSLRSFNNECDYCVDNVKFNNIDTYKKRIEASFDALNKLGRVSQVTITNDYKKLKMNELHLAFEYQTKKQEEKEEQRRLREEMREQEKLEREIKVARDRIAKERKHFSKAIEEMQARIENVKDEKELQNINAKLDELKTQYSNLEQEEKQIDYREQNAKAGYVYVISNLGSFGENVYKIGMTRRLEPLDRIYELGDASVPFPFDIHALIFSDNAPDLESKIQNRFYSGRMNKINNRKEFFIADIHEIETVVKENYNKVVDFEKIPHAEQYRESLLVRD
jgi:hypothetical protein